MGFCQDQDTINIRLDGTASSEKKTISTPKRYSAGLEAALQASESATTLGIWCRLFLAVNDVFGLVERDAFVGMVMVPITMEGTDSKSNVPFHRSLDIFNFAERASIHSLDLFSVLLSMVDRGPEMIDWPLTGRSTVLFTRRSWIKWLLTHNLRENRIKV